MKKSLGILSMAIVLLSSCGGNETSNKQAAKDKAAEMTNGAADAAASPDVTVHKKYDIKSGIVSFDVKMEMSGMAITSKKILYFDDYGNKESEEEYKNDVLVNRDFVKDGYRYTCSVENKGGAKTKAMGYGVATVFNMDEAATLKDSQFKKLGDETICGKPCNGFSMVTPSGNVKMYGWNHVNLKTTVESKSIKSSTTATRFEENVAIPADKFEVPDGVKMTEM